MRSLGKRLWYTSPIYFQCKDCMYKCTGICFDLANSCHMNIVTHIQESHLQICFTSESSSSKWWAIFLPEAKKVTWIDLYHHASSYRRVTMQKGMWRVFLPSSLLLSPLTVCCSAFLSELCIHISSVEWIVETNLSSCGHCKAPCTLLHSFLQVLRSSTSFGDIVYSPRQHCGSPVEVTLCRMHFHHHDAILVDILWHCSHFVHIHSMQLPE